MQGLRNIFITVAALATLLVCSCSDDMKFSTSPTSVLTFAEDTIRFDTVFTTIGSSTKRFNVFNNNDENLRLRSVRLSSSGKSGFRINVDGRYGTEFSDVEILRRDSIFVFAEVTVNPNDSDSPVLITDSVVFELENGIRQQVILEAYGQDAVILRGLTVTDEYDMTADRPYIIYDSLVVDSFATLYVNEGATLCFHSGASMIVYGQVLSTGTLDAPVTMRGDRLDRIFPYLPYDNLDSQWGGIVLRGCSYGNVFNYTDVHGGNFGIRCEATGLDVNKLRMTNSVIHNVAGNGLEMKYCSAQIANSQITNAKGDCVNILGGYADFIHCTIAQFYPWSATHGNALRFANVQNDTIYPLEKANFYNCLITGLADDEIYGLHITSEDSATTSDAAFNFLFDHCLINTDTAEAEQFFTYCTNECKDSVTYKESNFQIIDNENFVYDFQLDSLSVARGKGNPQYSAAYPRTRMGKPRDKERPDVGCY